MSLIADLNYAMAPRHNNSRPQPRLYPDPCPGSTSHPMHLAWPCTKSGRLSTACPRHAIGIPTDRLDPHNFIHDSIRLAATHTSNVHSAKRPQQPLAIPLLRLESDGRDGVWNFLATLRYQLARCVNHAESVGRDEVESGKLGLVGCVFSGGM